MKKPIIKLSEVPKDKSLIVFDLDGTLTVSKSNLDKEMAELLKKLLESKHVAVIGGGTYKQFSDQLVSRLKAPEKLLEKLFLFPTTSTTFYRYLGNKWKQIYSYDFTPDQKEKIFSAFKKVFEDLGYSNPKKAYGKVIEDRGTQITFSAVGQKAPVKAKEDWKKKNNKTRMKMIKMLQKELPKMEVKAGGLTSIDVTREGIDKKYGIEQIKKTLKIPYDSMLFVGDALFEGGNDSAVLKTTVPAYKVKDTKDTKKLIKFLLS